MLFSQDCALIDLQGHVLSCYCSGVTQGVEGKDCVLDLDLVLGANHDGNFVWGGKKFSTNAQNVKLLADRHTLQADLRIAESRQYKKGQQIDLDTLLTNDKGKLVLMRIPSAIAVQGDRAVDEAAAQLAEVLRRNTNLRVVQQGEKEGAIFWRIGVGTEHSDDDIIFTTWSVKAKGAVLRAFDTTGRKIQQVDITVLQATAGVEIGYVNTRLVALPTYVGFDAGLNLFTAQASVFDVQFGIGVDTSVGIKESSVEAQLAGCGIVIGRRIGISFFGSKVAVDLGRFFG